MIADEESDKLFSKWIRWTCNELSRYYILKANKDDLDFHCTMNPTPTSYVAFSENPQNLCLETETTSYNPYESYFRMNRRRTANLGKNTDSNSTLKGNTYDEVVDEEFLYNDQLPPTSNPIVGPTGRILKNEPVLKMLEKSKQYKQPTKSKPLTVEKLAEKITKSNACRRRKRKLSTSSRVTSLKENRPLIDPCSLLFNDSTVTSESTVATDLFANGNTLDDVVDHYFKQLNIESSNDSIVPLKGMSNEPVTTCIDNDMAVVDCVTAKSEENDFNRQTEDLRSNNENICSTAAGPSSCDNFPSSPCRKSSLIKQRKERSIKAEDKKYGKKSVVSKEIIKETKNKRVKGKSSINSSKKSLSRKRRLSKQNDELGVPYKRLKKPKTMTCDNNGIIDSGGKRNAVLSDPYRKVYITTSRRRESVLRKQADNDTLDKSVHSEVQDHDNVTKNRYGLYAAMMMTSHHRKHDSRRFNDASATISELTQVREIIDGIIANMISPQRGISDYLSVESMAKLSNEQNSTAVDEQENTLSTANDVDFDDKDNIFNELMPAADSTKEEENVVDGNDQIKSVNEKSSILSRKMPKNVSNQNLSNELPLKSKQNRRKSKSKLIEKTLTSVDEGLLPNNQKSPNNETRDDHSSQKEDTLVKLSECSTSFVHPTDDLASNQFEKVHSQKSNADMEASITIEDEAAASQDAGYRQCPSIFQDKATQQCLLKTSNDNVDFVVTNIEPVVHKSTKAILVKDGSSNFNENDLSTTKLQTRSSVTEPSKHCNVPLKQHNLSKYTLPSNKLQSRSSKRNAKNKFKLEDKPHNSALDKEFEEKCVDKNSNKHLKGPNPITTHSLVNTRSSKKTSKITKSNSKAIQQLRHSSAEYHRVLSELSSIKQVTIEEAQHTGGKALAARQNSLDNKSGPNSFRVADRRSNQQSSSSAKLTKSQGNERLRNSSITASKTIQQTEQKSTSDVRLLEKTVDSQQAKSVENIAQAKKGLDRSTTKPPDLGRIVKDPNTKAIKEDTLSSPHDKSCFVACKSKALSKAKVKYLINKFKRRNPCEQIRDVRVMLARLEIQAPTTDKSKERLPAISYLQF
ncbi:hypothetical protein GJ496_009165 [Pomphorhynchus laevis]|nr:hypothetical protein GJ496_009165 [Pomphorhynchus laevis]